MYQQWEKLGEQQYLLHTPSQYGELWPTNGQDRLAGLAPTNFNGFRVLASLLQQRRSMEVKQKLFWPSAELVYYIYIFRGSCSLTEFCQVQNSLCVQVLHSPVLAALLHGTGAVGISQTLQHGTRNGIMELLLLIIFNRERHLYSEGGHHVGHRPTF